MPHSPHWTGDPDSFVDALFAWMTVAGRICRCGSETALSQSLSVADRALADGAGRNDVCAGLLHTVGGLLVCTDFSCDTGAVRSRSHEIGARWLAAMFPHTVSEPIRLQPDARRWLFVTDKDFRNTLSDESTREMAIEGGPMVESDRQAFESREGFQAATALCRRVEWSKTRACSHWSPTDLALFRNQVIGCLVATPVSQRHLSIIDPARPEEASDVSVFR